MSHTDGTFLLLPEFVELTALVDLCWAVVGFGMLGRGLFMSIKISSNNTREQIARVEHIVRWHTPPLVYHRHYCKMYPENSS